MGQPKVKGLESIKFNESGSNFDGLQEVKVSCEFKPGVPKPGYSRDLVKSKAIFKFYLNLPNEQRANFIDRIQKIKEELYLLFRNTEGWSFLALFANGKLVSFCEPSGHWWDVG